MMRARPGQAGFCKTCYDTSRWSRPGGYWRLSVLISIQKETWTISPNWAASPSTSFCRLTLSVPPRIKATLEVFLKMEQLERALTWSQTTGPCCFPIPLWQPAGQQGCSLRWQVNLWLGLSIELVVQTNPEIRFAFDHTNHKTTRKQIGVYLWTIVRTSRGSSPHMSGLMKTIFHHILFRWRHLEGGSGDSTEGLKKDLIVKLVDRWARVRFVSNLLTVGDSLVDIV